MSGTDRDDGFETRAIHAGQEPDETTGAVIPPISRPSSRVTRRAASNDSASLTITVRSTTLGS